MKNENNKDIANSLSGYSNTINKGTNALLDGANQINKWYEKELSKIAEGNNQDTRFETNVDNGIQNEPEPKINNILKYKQTLKIRQIKFKILID